MLKTWPSTTSNGRLTGRYSVHREWANPLERSDPRLTKPLLVGARVLVNYQLAPFLAPANVPRYEKPVIGGAVTVTRQTPAHMSDLDLSGPQRWLVTGGLGFIGSHFVRIVLASRPNVSIVNLDVMTYAGNPANLADVAGNPRYEFVKGDICERTDVEHAIGSGVDAIINFAAESHVDRSILEPECFLRTDILGTHTLLEAARNHGVRRYVQVSTDEVYGDVSSGHSREDDPLAPRSPYSASKAGGDLQVLAYAATYGLPILITRGSNTYGPNQYPEKLIPLFVTNLLDDQTVPVYGDGKQIRDWLYVEDHARGVLTVLEGGIAGQIYNVGGGDLRENLAVTQMLLDLCGCSYETHVKHVTDRAGHDRRYSVDSSKTHALGWKIKANFHDGIRATVEWYRNNRAWWEPIKAGAYREYYQAQYAGREPA